MGLVHLKSVEIFEIPDDRQSSGSCGLTLQLNHPSDIGLDEIPHLVYHVDYQSRHKVITGTMYTFVVQTVHENFALMSQQLCGGTEGSVVDITPKSLPVPVSCSKT